MLQIHQENVFKYGKKIIVNTRKTHITFEFNSRLNVNLLFGLLEFLPH